MIKSKFKKVALMITLICMIIIGINIINTNDVHAYVIDKENHVAEIFNEDIDTIRNWTKVPANLFSYDGLSLWCIQSGVHFDPHMTASQAYYDAYYAGEESNTFDGIDATFYLDEDGNFVGRGVKYNRTPLVFKYYKNEGNLGLIEDHRDKYAEFLSRLQDVNLGYSPYDGDNQKTINAIENSQSGLPGVGTNVVQSIEYTPGEKVVSEENQDVLYILTAMPRYQGEIPLQPENLTEEQKEKGYFTVKEKQYALWESGATYLCNWSAHLEYDKEDRNLGEIAKKYKEFYEKIHNEKYEDTYSENIVVSEGYDKNGNPKHDNINHTKTNIDNKEYDLYVFDKTQVETDLKNKAYVLGPYCIDYTIDDENIDVYYTTDGYMVKYNAIENITVYNQDKINIEKLGGYFKIAYSYDGTITSKNEGKVVRINDEEYYELADGKEISGFDSRKEFYIIVYRGEMKAEEFKGFYAKIDFQYLEHIEGTLQMYNGKVYNYFYTVTKGDRFDFAYTQMFKKWQVVGYGEANGVSVPIWDWRKYSWTYSNSCDTYIYELQRITEGEIGQTLITSLDREDLVGSGKRIYKTYSIVITSEWTEENPEIIIYKECKDNGEVLYGAKFDVTLEINGTDIYKNEISKTITFTETTDKKGLAIINTRDFNKKGVNLGTFTGTINVTLKEVQAPAGHTASREKSYMTIKLEKGIITSVSSSSKNETEINTYSNYAMIKIYNDETPPPPPPPKHVIPVIQITKVDKDNNLVKEAYFEVHVSYTNSEGKLIDRKNNIIRGQTRNGVMYLSRNDFLNMDYGFDIQDYTGKITLNIVEVEVEGAYSLASESKDITLKYNKGKLVDYTEYTNAKVTTEYLYDSIKDNVYKYATGQIKHEDLNAYVRDYLDDWVKKQEKNTGMEYDDILAWLAEYIENNDESIMKEVTEMTTETNGNAVNITINDEIGELPDIDIPPPPEPDPLFMTVGGTVFLDQHTTKESANDSNGLLDEGEELLSGIEVTLYNKDGSIAELTDKNGEIRTNPTITDSDGYYEFRGVDPFGEYYVVFTYNGIEYTNTVSSEEKYNSDEWAKSSKGSEIIGDANTLKTRNYLNAKFSEITPNTYAYDYYTIQSLYIEIATRVQVYINTNNQYPNMEEIYAEVIANHAKDAEISYKIDYIKAAEINATAGYSSKREAYNIKSELYPYFDITGDLSRCMADYSAMNITKEEYIFAGEKVIAKLYPGQMQINLGLVERDRTDLMLLSDIVDTRVSMNGYDGIYEYNQDLSSYNQYIYKEDYNYKGSINNPGSLENDGVAYYTDDSVEFYMTYEIEITNETLTNTAITEIVDYYDENFTYANSYTTSKGIKLNGYKVLLNGEDITENVQISNESKYGFTEINTKNTDNTGYKKLFIRFKKDYMLGSNDKITVNLTFKMNEASATLYNKIYTEKGTSEYSKLWTIGNYAEINGYKTQGGFLDADSRPGNFEIAKYENAKRAYQEAYSNYVQDRTEENKRKLNLALGKFTDIREDDAWYVSLTLTNSGYIRELHGSVWEAISDEIKTASDLQENSKLLEYVKENGIKGISVELVELCDDKTEIIRAKTETDESGNYSFKSYIAGNYVVRFIYGEKEKHIIGKSTNSLGEMLEINGQYYQSTIANNKTNDNKYWYNVETGKRYSDAYDNANSRIRQINANVEGTDSTSSDYEYDGVTKIQSYEHKDTMYAYTSTLNIEIECAKPTTTGNMDNKAYEYKINNVDFGLTPRAKAELSIDQYVSNIKVYLQDGTLQLNADVDKDGKVNYVVNEQNPIYTNVVLTYNNSRTYLDGLIEALLDEELLNGATLEITYKYTVSNNGEYDTIKYIKNSNGTVIAVAYYNEKYNDLPLYEGDREEGTIVYHNDDTNRYSLEKYASEEKVEIRTAATNIVDYIDPNLNYIEVNKAGEKVNTNWEITNADEFKSSRENSEIMSRYNTIIRANNASVLYTKLLPVRKGEKPVKGRNYEEAELVLSKILETSSTMTNDWEYSNLVEITKIHNDAGKVTELNGYDITGEIEAETSIPKRVSDIKENIFATLGTAKSATLVIHAPTGLNIIENTESNIVIILVALIILAGGIILIKKFVIKTKAE